MGRILNPIARNLAYDTGYGAARGAVTNPPDDPRAGALAGGGLAMGGSVLGQGVGGLAGRGPTGVRSSPSVAWLRERGVTPTLGQIMRGRASDSGSRSIVAGFEDAISNTPASERWSTPLATARSPERTRRSIERLVGRVSMASAKRL